jgi:hypothetical protein
MHLLQATCFTFQLQQHKPLTKVRRLAEAGGFRFLRFMLSCVRAFPIIRAGVRLLYISILPAITCYHLLHVLSFSMLQLKQVKSTCYHHLLHSRRYPMTSTYTTPFPAP